MTKVTMPMVSLGGKGKVRNPIDSDYIDQMIATGDENLIFQNGFILAETGECILQEVKERIQIENIPFTAVYREQPTPNGRITIREKYYIPTNPRTTVQQANRQVFADAVEAWANLDYEEQIIWNKKPYPKHQSGYNRFIRNYMKTH